MSDWARFLKAARVERNWTQLRACVALREVSSVPLVEQDHLLRVWKRWEQGSVPTAFYADLLGRLFGFDGVPGSSPTLLVSGSRRWADPITVHRVLFLEFLEWSMSRSRRQALQQNFVVVHGGAGGVDTMAEEWVVGMRSRFPQVISKIVRPEYDKYPRWEAPKLRNQIMVNMRPHRLIAFHQDNSSGTRDCIERAELAGIEIHRYIPGNPDPEITKPLF